MALRKGLVMSLIYEFSDDEILVINNACNAFNHFTGNDYSPQQFTNYFIKRAVAYESQCAAEAMLLRPLS